MAEAESLIGESALVIRVPEAEDLVGSYRIRYDHAANVGVPAHITLLWPFVPPSLITPEVQNQLSHLFSSFPSFQISLTELRRFPEVLYLAPTPKDKIVELVQKIFATFPKYPPYGGQFTDITPHLTIAQSDDLLLLEKINDQIAPAAKQSLPIFMKVTEISLFEQHNGYWSKTRVFPLRTGTGTGF